MSPNVVFPYTVTGKEEDPMGETCRVVYDVTKDYDGDGDLDACEEWDEACLFYNSIEDNDEPIKPGMSVFDELAGYEKSRTDCRQSATIATLDVFLSHNVQQVHIFPPPSLPPVSSYPRTCNPVHVNPVPPYPMYL